MLSHVLESLGDEGKSVPKGEFKTQQKVVNTSVFGDNPP